MVSMSFFLQELGRCFCFVTSKIPLPLWSPLLSFHYLPLFHFLFFLFSFPNSTSKLIVFLCLHLEAWTLDPVDMSLNLDSITSKLGSFHTLLWLHIA